MRDLARTLTAADLSLLVVGTVIGSGILLVPGAVLRQTDGHAGLALCVWGVGGILSVLGLLRLPQGAPAPPAPGRAFAGAAVVLAGAPAFWLWRRVSQREVQ